MVVGASRIKKANTTAKAIKIDKKIAKRLLTYSPVLARQVGLVIRAHEFAESGIDVSCFELLTQHCHRQ